MLMMAMEQNLKPAGEPVAFEPTSGSGFFFSARRLLG